MHQGPIQRIIGLLLMLFSAGFVLWLPVRRIKTELRDGFMVAVMLQQRS